jgi:Leucine-rich repeat (LRR) protein/flagellar motor component MotA
MECFIVENGMERKAGLEDLFPLITDKDGRGFRYFLRELNNSDVDLAAAIAFLSDEIKEMVYRNVSPRVGGSLKKRVSYVETKYGKDSIERSKAKLIDFFGKYEKGREWGKLFPPQITWKESEGEEEKAKKPSPLESLLKLIEKALISAELDMAYYYTDGISQDDIHRQIGGTFKDHQNDLQKIRRLRIRGKDLPAAALLFETGKIEGLEIFYEFDDAANEFAGPSFLENCHALTKLILYHNGFSELPLWIRNAPSLRDLAVSNESITILPDWIGDLQSLTRLSLYSNQKLETLPGSIGDLVNLDELLIGYSPINRLPDGLYNLKNLKSLGLNSLPIKKIPDWLGDLESLTNLSLFGNGKLETLPDCIGNLTNLVKLNISFMQIEKLPDSMGNLKNLQTLSIERTDIEELPDWLGNLQSLTGLSLDHNGKLRTLPDSIGNLTNLTTLDLGYSPIEKLPDTIVNCTALVSVDIFRTEICSVPDFIKSVNNFNDNTLIEIIPPPTGRQGQSISYRGFCNSYYKLTATILAFSDKARREGLLALEEELEHIAEGFFTLGIRLVVDGTDAGIIRDILQTKLERENDFYRKKLLEVALEGIIGIQAGDSRMVIAFLLASLVNIENNPLAAACTKYLSGDIDAIDSVNLYAAIQSEEEREEIRFIKRAVELSEIARREGFLALEEHIDRKGIAARDVFEYGLLLVIDGWDAVNIAKILDNLIAHETDPVRKNISMAKKKAVLSINDGDNPRLLIGMLCAFFDEGIEAEIRGLFDE